MASYTKISLETASTILELYGLKNIVRLTPLSLGISNSNYKVELENSTVLLKISNDKNIEELNAEQLILFTISQRGYPYSLKPFAMSNVKGNNQWVYDYGDYHGVVYPFVEGIPPGPSDYTCQEVGKALAILHCLKITEEDKKIIRRHEKVGFGPKEILSYCEDQNCPHDFKQAVGELFPAGLGTFLNGLFAETIIHGDLYYDNTLFDHNQLKTVLDFEQAGIGECILDLGISISGTCLEKGRVISELVASYLRGYESIRPLPELEKKNLDDAILLGFMSIALWRIKRFYEGDLNPLMRNSYQDLMTKAKLYKEMRLSESL